MASAARETLAGRILPEILAAAEPATLVRKALAAAPPTGRCAVLAVGKAADAMSEAAVGLLGDRLTRAVVIVPAGGRPGPAPQARLERREADHPTPTERNVEAARLARALAAAMPAEQTLLLLLSGGASAMLCLPRPPLSPRDIASITDALLRAGAPIGELNTVRKHCEVLKGGGLAAASRAGLLALILSDVPGDRLDVIGSGPTAPDPTTFADALAVLQRRNAADAARAVTALLREGARGDQPESIKPGDPLWSRVENRIIGSNRLAMDAAAEACHHAGFPVASRREAVQGEAAEVGRQLARAALDRAGGAQARGAIVWGGETTVTVGGAGGRGGRNQELALAAAIELERASPHEPPVTILSLATDGRDGPTDAAGAVVDRSTAPAMRAAGVDPAAALARHDSHPALDAAGALLRTGPTGTNVNDVMIALWDSAR